MLPFNFDYYKPSSLDEAIELYVNMDRQGKQPMFLSGGTELITLGRIDLAFTEAVIDLKGIPECKVLLTDHNYLVIGSTLSLTKIEEANPFPLLSQTSKEVADHTARGKITIGGNIGGRIFYREAVLPFLLADSQLLLAGPKGERYISIHDIFHEHLRLERGEILVQLWTEIQFIRAPFFHRKRRQQWDMGYPLITVAAMKVEGKIRVAISGLCPYPFRSKEVETYLNEKKLSYDARIDRALSVLPSPILNDIEGSDSYRLFVLRNLFQDIFAALDEG